MKYYCKDCGEMFDEEEIVSKDEGFYTEYWGSSVWCPCYSSECPYCHSEDIEECSICDQCGEWFIPKTNKYLCEKCEKLEGE